MLNTLYTSLSHIKELLQPKHSGVYSHTNGHTTYFKFTQVFYTKIPQLPQINKIWLLNFIPSVPHMKPNLQHLEFQALLVVLTSHTSLQNVPIRNQNHVNNRKHTIF